VSKDYAESSESRRKKKKGKKSKKKSRPQTSSRGDKKPMPWKAVGLLVIVVVLIILGLALLSHYSHVKKQNQGAAVVTAKPVNISSAKAQAPIQPAEVVFSETPTQSTQSATNSRYMLQLGSYQKTNADFETLKNKLQKNKIHAKIIKTIHNDQTFYRVQLGPYKNQAAAQAMQQQLQQEKVYSVVRGIN